MAQCNLTWVESFGGIARFLVGNPWHAVTEFGGSIRIDSLKQPKFNLRGFGKGSKQVYMMLSTRKLSYL